MNADLAEIVASGKATEQEWNEYWGNVAASRQRASEPTPPKIEEPKKSSTSAGLAGLGLGSVLAVVLSFQLNHSILWAMAHAVCSWGYVIYRGWQGNY